MHAIQCILQRLTTSGSRFLSTNMCTQTTVEERDRIIPAVLPFFVSREILPSFVFFCFVTREIAQLGWIVIAGYAHSLIEREYLSRCNYRGWLIRSKFGIMGWKGVCDSTRVGEILDLFGLFKDQTIFMISIWPCLSFWSEMIKI